MESSTTTPHDDQDASADTMPSSKKKSLGSHLQQQDTADEGLPKGSAQQSSDAKVPSTPADDPDVTHHRHRRGVHIPSAFTILFVLTILAVIATWLVPAGSYSKLAYDTGASQLQITDPHGRTSSVPATQGSLDTLHVKIPITSFTSGAITKPVSIPGTYQRLEQHPAGFSDIVTGMVNGTIDAVDIIVFILVLGGMIGVVRATGAFETGLLRLTKVTKGHEFILVLAVSLLMILGGSTCGLEEEAVAFYPIIAPIFILMGYDSIVVVGAIFLAGSVGTCFSTINPFSSAIATNSAGIPLTDGMNWRLIGLAGGAVAVVCYLRWYCRRVQEDPTFSYTLEDRESFDKQWGMDVTDETVGRFTWRRKVSLILFIAAFPLMVVGVINWGWWFPQMAASFLALTIIIMLLSRTGSEKLSEKQLVDAFSDGSSSLVAVSLIIGLARGINLILEQGFISDTMLQASTSLVTGMPGPAFVLTLLVVFFVLGFVVPSSSGLAVLAMPIMAPLADTVNLPRSIVVCAYQWGQYAMLFLAPTGLVMATLQMLDIKYSHWLRFVWPMVVFVLVWGGGLLVAQSLMV